MLVSKFFLQIIAETCVRYSGLKKVVEQTKVAGKLICIAGF